jgi:hypothetical protein
MTYWYVKTVRVKWAGQLHTKRSFHFVKCFRVYRMFSVHDKKFKKINAGTFFSSTYCRRAYLYLDKFALIKCAI